MCIRDRIQPVLRLVLFVLDAVIQIPVGIQRVGRAVVFLQVVGILVPDKIPVAVVKLRSLVIRLSLIPI